MTSKTEIVNLALSHLNQGLQINSLDERSQSAVAANLVYDLALETILRARDWPFARKSAEFTVTPEKPTNGWTYAYRYPPDCVAARLPKAYGYDNVPLFEIGSDENGQVVYSNFIHFVIPYTWRNEVVETYPADFVMALSYLLASLMAPRLTGGDPFKLGPYCEQRYLITLEAAAVHSYNESPIRKEPSGFQKVR